MSVKNVHKGFISDSNIRGHFCFSFMCGCVSPTHRSSLSRQYRQEDTDVFFFFFLRIRKPLASDQSFTLRYFCNLFSFFFPCQCRCWCVRHISIDKMVIISMTHLFYASVKSPASIEIYCYVHVHRSFATGCWPSCYWKCWAIVCVFASAMSFSLVFNRRK